MRVPLLSSSAVLAIVLLVLCLALQSPPSSALHSAGFTWSASPSIISTTALTEYHALTGPYATIFYYYIYVAYKPLGSTAIQYLGYDWGSGTPWSAPMTIPHGNSSGGAALIDYYTQLTAVWSDAATSTLRFAIQNTRSSQWGMYSSSTYGAHQSPPNLYTPYSAQMFVFHRQPLSTEWGNCSYDGYTVFEDYPQGRYTQSYSHGSTAVNNIDVYTYIFYQGVASGGNADGYIHWMAWDSETDWWSGDMTSPFAIDIDSTISAQPWENSTDTYIFVFYKYQNVINYVALRSSSFTFVPSSGSTGFSTGLATISGPTAVIYQDPFYDTMICSVFFSKWNPSYNSYLIYNAVGIPDNWP